MRQPVPAAQAFVLVFSAVGFGLARHWAGPLTTIEVLLALVLLEFTVQPVSYLIHELGHGVVACRLGAESASIIVGRGPWLRFSVGRIKVNFSPLPSRGVMIRGVCRYHGNDLSWRSRAAVALAGPAATLLELLVALGLAALVWQRAGSFERNLFVLTVIGLVASLVVNLAPMKVKRDGREVGVGNDGANARLALRRAREGGPVAPTQPPGQPANPSRAPTGVAALPPAAPAAGAVKLSSEPGPITVLSPAEDAQRERARDLARGRTSVPPPSVDTRV